MDQIVQLLKLALHALEIGWDIANDPDIEREIEAMQRDIQKLVNSLQADLDKDRSLDG